MEARSMDRIGKRSTATAFELDGNGLLMEAARAERGIFLDAPSVRVYSIKAATQSVKLL